MRLIDADELMESIRKALGIKSMAKSLLLPAERTIIDQIDSAPTIGGWISVKDRLPIEKENPLTKDFAEVICYCDFGGIPKRTDVRVYKFGKRTWMEDGHFWLGWQCMDGVITHWMPMPEPPEEDKEE